MLSNLIEAIVRTVGDSNACGLGRFHVDIINAHCIVAHDLEIGQRAKDTLSKLPIFGNCGVGILERSNHVGFIVDLHHSNFESRIYQDSNFCAAILMTVINNNNLHGVPSSRFIFVTRFQGLQVQRD